MDNLKQSPDPAVLLIDDTLLILDLLQDILEEHGYRVLRSTTGKDVASILSQEQVAVVFCDILLPNINGVEVLRQIKQQVPEVQVVIVSGQQNFGTAREVFRERALDYLVKPFAAAEVLAAVEQGFAAYYLELHQKQARIDSQRKMAELVLLKQIGKTASAGSDLQDLFEGILDSIVQSAGVEIASLMLVGNDGIMHISAARGIPPQIVESVAVAPGEGIAGHVLQMREPILIQNIRYDDRFNSLVEDERYKNQSLLSVPILYSDKVLGVINVNYKRSGEAFNLEDQNLLMAIAHQVALAIENFKLVTSLRQQARTLERTNADLVKLNLARTRLVCNLSHELKTPLTSIMGFVDLVSTFYERFSAEDIKDYLGQAREEGVRLEGLITSMLRLFSIESEREPWNWKAFNLGWAISETFQYHGKRIARNQLKVEVELAEDLPDAYGDPEKFGIALNALLDNAVKFNREGGRLSIRAERREIEGLDYVYLQVQNDGVSIPPEAKGTIFDSYTQLGNINTEKPHGVGIGLSLVRVVLNKMKGRVFLEERDGEGASFGLLLPSEETYGALRD